MCSAMLRRLIPIRRAVAASASPFTTEGRPVRADGVLVDGPPPDAAPQVAHVPGRRHPEGLLGPPAARRRAARC
ncbi:hypothetical protein [Streptomyces sp. A0958]|uniref:hypothetical protein n=1 Tax=Streptomyces sp. A0958 TaxID=2563101 RepID=UPI0014462C4D|nr:hypothetical protein [Streptomyces sp. A0958]